MFKFLLCSFWLLLYLWKKVISRMPYTLEHEDQLNNVWKLSFRRKKNNVSP
jgi:hypothetical protein